MPSFFRKAAKAFDQVTRMVTRELPVPELEGTARFFQATAKRGRDGFWTVTYNSKAGIVTDGVEDVYKAYTLACARHARKLPESKTGKIEVNFNAAFLILREMEEALLKYNDTLAGPEPKNHFNAAHRLLPVNLKRSIDDTFFTKIRENGPVLAPKTVKKLKSGTKPAAPK